MDWLESVTEYMRLGLELGLSYTSAQHDTPGTGQEGERLQKNSAPIMAGKS